ncbi:MAG TPA: hypothetical protein VFE33_18875 [Thermoanaerobaculia bacterium]|nr:hypothetical protein [Thermoanaerobaculia bacterium]
MARDAHSTFRALELLPHHLTAALEDFERREAERKKPTLSPIAVTLFSAIIALGAYRKEDPTTIILVASVYLLVVLVAYNGGNWLLRKVRDYRKRHEPIGITTERDAEKLADAFNRVGVNEFLMADGLFSCGESVPETDVAARGFFATEAVYCFDRAAQTTLKLTFPPAAAKKAVRFDPPLPRPQDEGLPVARAVDEDRVRWAVQFAESLRVRFNNLPTFPGKDKLSAQLDLARRVKLQAAIDNLDRLKTGESGRA